MDSNLPRVVITSEIRESWAADTLRVERSLERVRREMDSGLCDICGTPLDVKLAPKGPAFVTYACEHWFLRVPQQ